MAKTAITWESVVKTLKVLGTGSTRYGDAYTIYAWDKENHAFIEWWYERTSAQRKAEGIVAGMTPFGFGIRDLRNTAHAPKAKPAVKGKKTVEKSAVSKKSATKVADSQSATQPVTNWAELFNKQQAILSSLMDRMTEVESAVKALQPKRKTVKK